MIMYDSYGFPQYVSVAERTAQAQRMLIKLKKKNPGLSPVVIEGRQIARSVWGKAWCKHLENFSDYSNRIPRGKNYVRSGAVVDLHIEKGLVTALVTGSSSTPYKVRMEIACLRGARKEKIEALFREAESLELLDLLQGKIPAALMSALTDTREGLFPMANEVKHSCTCPDYADFCKHQAAVLYGVGNRLDAHPELLFTLRGLDSAALTTHAEERLTQASMSELGDVELSALFGVELAESTLWDASEPQQKKEVAKARQASTSASRITGSNTSPAHKTPMEQLLYIRKYTQWEDREMADQLSTTQNRISKWLSGQITPSPPYAARIETLYKEIRETVRKVRSRK